MAQSLIEKGKTSSEYTLTTVGVGAGFIYQTVSDAINAYANSKLETSEIVAMATKDVSPIDIVRLSEHMVSGGDQYIGAIFALLLAGVYIIKRAVLKYFELKGMIAIELAKIQIEVEIMKAKARKDLEAFNTTPSERVEGPNERADIIIP